MENATQTDHILAHLRAGYSLTPLEAMDLFGCIRLAARIYDLRQDGWPIEDEKVRVPVRGGGTTRVCRYRLPQGRQLEIPMGEGAR